MRIRKTETLAALLAQEDTDGSNTITVDDTGPKSFTVKGEDGDTLQVDGTYYLANLLQEIWLGNGVLEPEKVFMKPLERVDYLMQNHYWHTLSRRMDADNILTVLSAAATKPICMSPPPMRTGWRTTDPSVPPIRKSKSSNCPPRRFQTASWRK